jgi:hypothetical protein
MFPASRGACKISVFYTAMVGTLAAKSFHFCRPRMNDWQARDDVEAADDDSEDGAQSKREGRRMRTDECA